MSGSSAAWQAMTLARALRAAAQRNPGKLAMVQGADRGTCGELGTRIDALRNAAITKLGVRKGDNVAIVSRNCFEFIEVVTALPDAGAAVAMVNPRGAPPEMTATLDDCGATVLFADAPSAEFARSSGRRVIVFGPEYEALLAGAVAPSELPQIEEWDAWTIPYTSGTTGKPKGMSPGQAVTIAMLGNLVVLVPILLIGHAGAKYGIPFPVLARASFGTIGARLPALARALVALAVFWLAQLVVIEKGILAIRKFETWTAPLKVVVCIALVWWAVSNAGGLGPIWSQPPAFEPGGAKAGQFWVVFWPMFTAMSGYWGALALNIPDFTRFAHSQKDQLVGQAAGLPEPMAALALMSVVVTSARS